MSQPIKLQINSLEAIERLIGGDSPLELELRNSVVQEFAKKHLKSIAPTVVNGLTYAARESAEQLVKDLFGSYDKPHSAYRKFILNQEFQDVIRENAKTAMTDEIKAIIEEETRRYLDAKETSTYFYRAMKRYVDETLTGETFKSAVCEAVNKKLAKTKDVLNLVLEGEKV